MWPYWLMFILPALVALTRPPRPWLRPPTKHVLALEFSWLLIASALAVLVGLRHQVGGDWDTYLQHSFAVAADTLEDAISGNDPGYWLVTWFTGGGSNGIYIANLLFAAVFSFGLVVFCRAQPRPWLALAVAIPYLVIVVGMGYTRQGVALALCMIALVALSRGRTLAFVCWVALGATFHRSAVILIPLGMIATPRNRFWTAIWVSLAALALYDALLRQSVEALEANYLEAEYQSEGALVRVLMNVLPAAILLSFRKRFQWNAAERNLWTILALLALVSAAWLLVSPSSTAVDRVALYLIPLQMYVFARFPDIVDHGRRKQQWVAMILFYYALVQFVWLFFATHSAWWLPYRFYPLEGISF